MQVKSNREKKSPRKKARIYKSHSFKEMHKLLFRFFVLMLLLLIMSGSFCEHFFFHGDQPMRRGLFEIDKTKFDCHREEIIFFFFTCHRTIAHKLRITESMKVPKKKL